ncbi:hypothetical protein FVEG_14710 [Fusarium verticillioides 7600]|uniref:Uncharacterized protein n=1 Tax=Gibberella moniliformis (strain M3125 / FGSC 7600) TaxID=334819 RepID=W7LMS2_GIBM7|nr:hypothetical protein FVEG_14710 [Fusarium verticillioides 7600]EWG36755.1 hypothetical protein FVEG_14710 [Fusarium verticillioides 7600]
MEKVQGRPCRQPKLGTDASRAAPGVVTAKRSQSHPCLGCFQGSSHETDADADEATAWPATTQSRAPTHDFALNPLHSHHKALAFARLSKSTNGKTPDTFNCNTSRYYFYFISRKH